MAVDDEGNAFELSADPLLDTLRPYVEELSLGDGRDIEKKAAPILHMNHIFGVDLYEIGMADKVCGYLKELIAGPGAVRATLKKYLS